MVIIGPTVVRCMFNGKSTEDWLLTVSELKPANIYTLWKKGTCKPGVNILWDH